MAKILRSPDDRKTNKVTTITTASGFKSSDIGNLPVPKCLSRFNGKPDRKHYTSVNTKTY